MKQTNQIILIDDEATSIELIYEILKMGSLAYQLKIVQSGPELLNWLDTNSLPNLIVVDINMPSLDGFDLLKSLKRIDRYKPIPVVMLSMSEQDVQQSFDLGANGYIVKPEHYSDLLLMINEINKYWSDVASTSDPFWSKPNNN